MGNLFSGHTNNQNGNNPQNTNTQNPNTHTLTQEQFEQYKYFMEQQKIQKEKIKEQKRQLALQNKKISKIKKHITNHISNSNPPRQIENPYQYNTDVTPNQSGYSQKGGFESYSRYNKHEVDNTAQFWNQAQPTNNQVHQAQQAQQTPQTNTPNWNTGNTSNSNKPQWKTNPLNSQSHNQQHNQYHNQQYQQKQMTEEEYKQHFIRKQNRRRQKYEKKLAMFDNHQVFDPHKILNIPTDYNLSQLKVAYKQAALQTHPDKGGNPKLFKLVTKAYMYLLDKHKNQESKQYSNLKQDFKQFTQNQYGGNGDENMGSGVGNIHRTKTMEKFGEDGGFNNQLFNKIYTDHRLYSINDDGYAKWMKDKKNKVKRHNPIKNSKLFSKNFNIDVFNSVFENLKNTQTKSQALIEYREPNALNMMATSGYTSLGQDRISDFSSDTGGGMNFSDYKQAHSNNFLINPNMVKTHKKKYKDVQHLQKSRSKISYEMNDMDKLRYQQLKEGEKERERSRRERLEYEDYMAKQQFDKLNQLMLQ